MYDETTASVVISRQKGIGSRTFKELIDKFGSAREVLNPERLEEVKLQFGNNVYLAIKSIGEKELLKVEDEVKKAEKLNIKVVPYSSPLYPALLKNISDPPAVLYIKGNFPENSRYISVVGTRRHSSYGVYVVENIVRNIAKSKVCIVSGLATGIDTMAHRVALEEGADTVAVLGSGVDVVYPPENRKIYRTIEERGCLVSEFPPGTQPSKYTFPLRNRVIAGLSYATFVVEAPEKSGSLITANLAFDYSRIVLTVPANINLQSAAGNNKLIRENIAVPITSFDDIKAHIPFFASTNIENIHTENLSEKESHMLDFLVNHKHIDEILERFDFDPEVDTILLKLRSLNLIKEEGGFYYRIV